MRAFIFDKYGYYIDDEYGKEFDYQNWHFKLERNDKNEEELNELNIFINEIDNTLFKRGVRIIETREKTLSSLSEFGQVSLVGVNIFKVSLYDVIKIHTTYSSSNNSYNAIKISDLKKLWEDKITLVEEKILPSLKIDNYIYEKAMVSAIHALGLAENAISYLEDASIDYSNVITNLSVSHKRLTSYNSYDLLNPFNLVLDSPMRDLGELFKFGSINEKELIDSLKYYSLSKLDVSLLLARILFPTNFFDLLEDHYGVKKDIRKEVLLYYNGISKFMIKVRYIHNYLVKTYNIRPINWLMN